MFVVEQKHLQPFIFAIQDTTKTVVKCPVRRPVEGFEFVRPIQRQHELRRLISPL